MRGVNHQNMIETNKFLILKTIATCGPISRIELSKKTQLSKMTITSLIADFLEEGIVRECGTSASTSGRRPTLLEVVPDSLLTLGISVGRDYLQVGIINLTGAIVLHNQVPIGQFTTEDSFINGLLAMCEVILQNVPIEKVWGIGIASIGPINMTEGVIIDPPDFNIDIIHIVPRLKERWNLPVYIENDMAVSALAEMYYGGGKQYNNFVYVGVTAGIGGGVILNQRLYSGTNGLASIIGHMIVQTDGELCACGQRGCLEAMSSVRATLHWAHQNGAPHDLDWMQLLIKAEAGDAICSAALERMNHYLLSGLINIVNLYDPECIFIGGDLWFAKDQLFQHFEQEVNARIIAAGNRRKVQIARSKFPVNAFFIGNAALVMENNLEYRRVNRNG